MRLEEERVQLVAESDNRITELENELAMERDHAKNLDFHYRERILKPLREEREQLKKQNTRLTRELHCREEKIKSGNEQLVASREIATQTISSGVAEEISDLYSQLEL